MAVQKSKKICITSVKGGVGKTIMTLNLAGVISKLNKKVLVVDLDLSNNGISFALSLDVTKDLYKISRDIKNNQYRNFSDYVIKYNDNIDILPAPTDPRDANKISPKYIELILDKANSKYDFILLDTNHILSDTNLVAFDNSDTILYILPKDLMAIKTMRSMVTIYNEMQKENYKIILYNIKPENKQYSNYDINHMVDKKIDYKLDNLYVKNIDNYLLQGKILTLDKKFTNSHKKGMKTLEKIVEDLL